MATTIQISSDLLNKLQLMKMHSKESYEDIIWDLIEDQMELSEETKKNIAEAEKDIKAGRVTPFEEIKKKMAEECTKLSSQKKPKNNLTN